MKNIFKTLFAIVTVLYCCKVSAQVITIPDANFKRLLLMADINISIALDSTGTPIKIDTNNDSLIQQSELNRVYSLFTGQYEGSFEGIQYFNNLQKFGCNWNPIIDSIDLSGLVNLREIECSQNSHLKALNLSGCINLNKLICNQDSLVNLDVSNLPNLQTLSCQVNKMLTSLNVNGCSNLEYLYSQDGDLLSLNIIGCPKLKELALEYNKLISLNVRSCSSLEKLNCSYNNLRSLNVSELHNLQSISCTNNRLITLNIDNCENLTSIRCEENELVSLNVTSNVALIKLYCSYNQLTNLTVFKNPNIQEIVCVGNQLSLLDISGCTHLTQLDCSINPIKSVYMKNNIDNSGRVDLFVFYNNPTLEYICADEVELVALKQRLISLGFTNITYSSICNSILDGTISSLNGKTKLDADNNGCTSLDANYPYLKIKVKNTTDSGYIFADAQGNFSIDVDSGIYTFTPQLPNNYFSCTPSAATITLPDTTTPLFCITPNGVHHDVEVTFIPVRAARPGFSDATYKIVLRNKSNQIENGTILFSYDENKQDYLSATQTPTNVSSGALIFAFTNLQLFEIREIIVTMRTNAPTDIPAVNAGDVLQLSVNALINADENTDDNTRIINQTVVGSFDPNDKTCLEGNIITPTLVGDFVNYLIRFENTGTANAENIVVTDLIDLNKFDISTLEITSTSHNCKTVISNGNKVQFVFDNINLPFTAPNKYGYVAFKIKTKNNLVIGDSLKNKADIYFDYNLPIITNTATSRIDNITGKKNNSKKDGSLSVYPNPGNGNFTVNFESKGIYPITIKVTDFNGKTVYEQKMAHHERSTTPIELQDLTNGMYLLQIASDKDVWIQKLLIVK